MSRFLSTAHNRRRRVRYPTQQHSTTRDRIRRVIERNTAARKPTVLLDAAQGRLSWLRKQVYTYWNPDYRPVKQGLVMDARWWRWNLLLMAMPSILLAVYCEIRAKHLVHEFNNLQAQELRESGQDVPAAPPLEDSVTRIRQIMQQLETLLGWTSPSDEEECQDTTASDESETTVDKIQGPPAEPEETSLEELKRRIELLEQQQLEKKRNPELKPQSGIRNRAQDSIKNSYKIPQETEQKSTITAKVMDHLETFRQVWIPPLSQDKEAPKEDTKHPATRPDPQSKEPPKDPQPDIPDRHMNLDAQADSSHHSKLGAIETKEKKEDCEQKKPWWRW
jgi:hypothetical protein